MTGDIFKLGKGLSIDGALLEGAVAELSPEEISRRLSGALSPARVVLRTRELLKKQDWLTEAEKERALLRMLQDRVNELRRANDLDSIKVQHTIIKDLLVQLQRRQAVTDEQLRSYNSNMGRAMMRAFDIALAHIGGAISDRVSIEEFRELKRDGLAVAQAEVIKNQVDS